MDSVVFRLCLVGMIGVGALAGLMAPMQTAPLQAAEQAFAICHTGGGRNCVVDGDTAWIDGVKVRVLDIDAPETHPPRCDREAELGERATQRLAALLSEGSLQLVAGDRDTDRYGRKLRRIIRDGRSIGNQLVLEGLARPYGGGRKLWC